ncbi:MAG: SDR family oxidoreductase [Clostridiaceae bacterium]|jgi:NAD(P)-dependent dehydrogenase (short-subunit alcohol dehydrogenase family)|nr:SDR family oxidoreductase [Clostridiaceae bacterium]
MKYVLVTGISRNIGKSICKKFLQQGYFVVGICRSITKPEAQAIKKTEKNFTFFTADFRYKNDITKLIAKLKRHAFDVIVNNAGILNLKKDGAIVNEFNDFNIDDYEAVINCNFYAPLRICLELKENINENGSIVNIASGGGMRASYATLSYSTSKAALINLTQSLSNSFYPFKKIRVNAVSPGWVDPESTGGMAVEAGSAGSKAALLTAMGRNAKTTEIADVVYFLTTEEASFINGANIPVDGGWLNHNVICYEEATGKALIKDE